MRLTKKQSLVAVAATGLMVAGSLAVAGSATASGSTSGAQRTVLPTGAPTWVGAKTDIGAVPANRLTTARIYLQSADPAGLVAYAQAVADPGSASYRHYLSPSQTAARFGPSSAARARVEAWARSAGLRVSNVSGEYVEVSAAASALGSAFGTSLHSYRHGGQVAQAPSGAVSLPSALAGDVVDISGLSNGVSIAHPMNVGRTKVETSAKPAAGVTLPCSAYYRQKMATGYPKAYGQTQPFAVCGYQPKQLRGAYGITGTGLTGKGITVAVVDAFASPKAVSDVNRWAHNRGEAPLGAHQLTQYVPQGTGYNAGWGGEELLDLEAIKAVAPKANIAYVAAKADRTIGDFLDPLQQIVRYHLADAVNSSWELDTDTSISTSDVRAFRQTFQMGAVEGIGFYFSSGDGGGVTSHGKPYVFYPGSDPFVTSVGGSAIGITKNDHYAWETSWETDYATLSKNGKSWTPSLPGVPSSGAGGGVSTISAQPYWQRGVVPDSLSKAGGGKAMRVIPDIAAVADPTTGFLEGDSEPDSTGKFVYTEYRIGGTSLSSPLIVGMQALAEQAQHGVAIGFANPSIYQRYGSTAYHDVTSTPFGAGHPLASVRTIGTPAVVALGTAGQAADLGLTSTVGYDTTTGVGTPTRAYFQSFRR